ncbi:uncharacterized protein HD556DRAFT_1206000, partial [Suillus plorans]
FLLIGGFMSYVDRKPHRILRPDEVLELIRARCIDAPTLMATQFSNKKNGNRMESMLQVAWFVLQLITRVIHHLKITELELAVGIIALVLNFLTYAVRWNK